MAKASDITVNVNVCMVISDETAQKCLRLLEMWQENNADKKIIGERQPDGRTVFRIVSKGEDDA